MATMQSLNVSISARNDWRLDADLGICDDPTFHNRVGTYAFSMNQNLSALLLAPKVCFQGAAKQTTTDNAQI